MPAISPTTSSTSSPTIPGASFTSVNVGFASVKLPGSFVQEAKQAALAMRRSTAGQIEYWALLGKAVEDGGLTVKEAAQALSASYPPADTTSLLDGIEAQFAQAEAGALRQRMREVVLGQRAQGGQNVSNEAALRVAA